MNPDCSSVLIAGAGNPLMGDDGAGIRVIELLEQIPNFKIDLYDCGTDLLRLGSREEKYEDVILLDAVQTGAQPGTVHWFTQEQLLSFSKTTSAHQISLLEALALLPVMNPLFRSVRFSIIGIEPEEITCRQTLSRSVQQAVESLSRLIGSEGGLQTVIDRCQSLQTISEYPPGIHESHIS